MNGGFKLPKIAIKKQKEDGDEFTTFIKLKTIPWDTRVKETKQKNKVTKKKKDVHEVIVRLYKEQAEGKTRDLSEDEIKEMNNEEISDEELRKADAIELPFNYNDNGVDPWIYKPPSTKTLVSYENKIPKIIPPFNPIASPCTIISCSNPIKENYDDITNEELIEDLEYYDKELKSKEYDYIDSYTKYYYQLKNRNIDVSKFNHPNLWKDVIRKAEKKRMKKYIEMTEEEYDEALISSLRKLYNYDDSDED